MRLVAFDLETTGLNPATNHVLQIGAVVFESETGAVVDTFEELVTPPGYGDSPYALAMNQALLYEIAAAKSPPNFETVQASFADFLYKNGCNKAHAVGFNVGSFDLQFGFKNLFHHRTIELGSLLMGKFESDIPVTSAQWHKHQGKEVAHTALADCLEAVEAYRFYKGL